MSRLSPKFPQRIADAELGPGFKRLITCVLDPPLMSVRAADIPVVSSLSSPAGIPLSAALPVMAVAILSVWAAHCTPEASPVHESAPEASPVHESAPEASSVHKSAAKVSPVHVSTPVPPEVAASAAEPPEVAASAAEPPEVVVPTFELTVCHVTATEAVAELTACPVMTTDAVHELTACPCHGEGGRP